MRELFREKPLVPTSPVPDLPDLIAEAQRLARLLRIGHEELAAAELDPLLRHINASLAELSRTRGDAQHMKDVLPAMQEVALQAARQDPIALADALEHQLARRLLAVQG